MTDINYPIHGSCQCGQVRYTLHSAPDFVAACHCRECQKLSTSAFSITAMVKAENLTFEGELKHWERKAHSGATNAAAFCPTCGNRIYHYNPEKPEQIKLKPSNLDDTRLIKPTIHIWTSQKQDWYTIPEGVDQHPTQPGG